MEGEGLDEGRKPVWEDELKGMEARVGIEPTHKGFADLSLTTWVPRPGAELSKSRTIKKHSCTPIIAARIPPARLARPHSGHQRA